MAGGSWCWAVVHQAGGRFNRAVWWLVGRVRVGPWLAQAGLLAGCLMFRALCLTGGQLEMDMSNFGTLYKGAFTLKVGVFVVQVVGIGAA